MDKGSQLLSQANQQVRLMKEQLRDIVSYRHQQTQGSLVDEADKPMTPTSVGSPRVKRNLSRNSKLRSNNGNVLSERSNPMSDEEVYKDQINAADIDFNDISLGQGNIKQKKARLQQYVDIFKNDEHMYDNLKQNISKIQRERMKAFGKHKKKTSAEATARSEYEQQSSHLDQQI